MKLDVIGIRTFSDDIRINAALNDLPATEILTSGSNPTATAATWYAAVKELPTRRFEANLVQYGSRAKQLRDRQLVEAADALLAFWNGQSVAVREAIEYAHELRKRVVVLPC